MFRASDISGRIRKTIRSKLKRRGWLLIPDRFTAGYLGNYRFEIATLIDMAGLPAAENGAEIRSGPCGRTPVQSDGHVLWPNQVGHIAGMVGKGFVGCNILAEEYANAIDSDHAALC